jgi:short subunit dehydrogenase-like uncharacterized protein
LQTVLRFQHLVFLDTPDAHKDKVVQEKDAEAKAKGVMLLPAVGFDVVPGDCLAAHLKEKVPTATHLDLETFITRNSTGVMVSPPLLASQNSLLASVARVLEIPTTPNF